MTGVFGLSRAREGREGNCLLKTPSRRVRLHLQASPKGPGSSSSSFVFGRSPPPSRPATRPRALCPDGSSGRQSPLSSLLPSRSGPRVHPRTPSPVRRPYGTAALNATPRQWLPHAYRRIRNLCGSRPHIAYFPPKIPLGCLMSLADLTRTALSSRLSLPGRLPPSPHLGDWQLGCSSWAGRTPPSRGASRWLPTADSLTFRSPVTLTTSCGPLSPLAWPPRWPYFRVTQKPARTFRPSRVADAMSSRLRRVGVKPIP